MKTSFLVIASLIIVTGCQAKEPKAVSKSTVATPVTTTTPTAPEKLVVYYFHGNIRCPTCHKLETYAREAVEAAFGPGIKSGAVEWKTVNTEEPGNEHFIKEYKLYSKSVVVSRQQGGKEVAWKNLDQIWNLVRNQDEYKAYITNEVTACLSGNMPMNSWWLDAGTALWLGILTSISPCPLATNIAAISYVGRRVGATRRVLLSGLLYTLGRALAYVTVAIVVTRSLQLIPGVSNFLQKYMNLIIGPLVAVAGLLLLDVFKFSFGGGMGGTLQSRVDRMGVWGAGLLGVIFALTFCPISAGLFFGALVPMAVQSNAVTLPLLYGVGTAVPVIVFALILAFAAHQLGTVFNKLTVVEKWARRVTAVVFLGAGVYLTLRYTFRVF